MLLGGRSPDGTSLPPTEIYNPATGLFTPGPNLATGRVYHTATLLTGGSVLVVGGASASAGGGLLWLDTAEVVVVPHQ